MKKALFFVLAWLMLIPASLRAATLQPPTVEVFINGSSIGYSTGNTEAKPFQFTTSAYVVITNPNSTGVIWYGYVSNEENYGRSCGSDKSVTANVVHDYVSIASVRVESGSEATKFMDFYFEKVDIIEPIITLNLDGNVINDPATNKESSPYRYGASATMTIENRNGGGSIWYLYTKSDGSHAGKELKSKTSATIDIAANDYVSLSSIRIEKDGKVTRFYDYYFKKLETPVAPTFSYESDYRGKEFVALNKVSILQSQGYDVYYTIAPGTTNSATPDNTSTLYTGPIEVTETSTINAVAYNGFAYGPVASTTVVKRPQQVTVNFISDALGRVENIQPNDEYHPYLYVDEGKLEVINPNTGSFVRAFTYVNGNASILTSKMDESPYYITIPEGCDKIYVKALKDGVYSDDLIFYVESRERPEKPVVEVSKDNGRYWSTGQAWFDNGGSMIFRMSADEGCQIYYTFFDGEHIPTVDDCTTLYDVDEANPVYPRITQTSWLGAVAVKDGIKGKLYVSLYREQPAAPDFTVETEYGISEGVDRATYNFLQKATVIVNCAEGEEIRYKLNGIDINYSTTTQREFEFTESTYFEFCIYRGMYGEYNRIYLNQVEDMWDGVAYDPATASHIDSEICNIYSHSWDKKKTFVVAGVGKDNVVHALSAIDATKNDAAHAELTMTLGTHVPYYAEDGTLYCDISRVRDFYLGQDADGLFLWCGEYDKTAEAWTYYVLTTDLRTSSLFLMTPAEADSEPWYEYHLDIDFVSPATVRHRVAAGEASAAFPYVDMTFRHTEKPNTLSLFNAGAATHYFAAAPTTDEPAYRMALFVAKSVGTTGVEDIESAPTAEPVYYDLQGRTVEHPQAGRLYIVRRGADITKEVYGK